MTHYLFEESHQASTVRAELSGNQSSIEIFWDFDVPWSNSSLRYPIHYIYRNNVNGSNPADFVIIDSVDVIKDGFRYLDDGSFENITLGAESLFSLRRNQKKAQTKIKSIMSHSGLDAPLDIPVGKLSVGERQRVEILKALYRDVHILVLDEPTAVLTPQEADSLFSNLRRMTNQGLSVIFITHKMREVLSFSDRLVVLRDGKNVGSMKTSDASEKKIARLMVGSETQKVSAKRIKPGGPIFIIE